MWTVGRRLAVPAFVVLATLSAACGGGNAGSGSGGPDVMTGSTAAPGLTVPAGAPQVDQQDSAFKPARLTASVGETIYFLNRDSAIHNVKINGKDISGRMKKGDVVAWTGSVPGEYKLSCDYHPMKATITLR